MYDGVNAVVRDEMVREPLMVWCSGFGQRPDVLLLSGIGDKFVWYTTLSGLHATRAMCSTICSSHAISQVA